MGLNFNFLESFSDTQMGVFLEASHEAIHEDGITEPWISTLLFQLAVANGAKRILEIGVYKGNTSIWLALAVSRYAEGQFIGLDNEMFVPLTKAEERLKLAGLEDHAELVRTDAEMWLKDHIKYRAEPFDLIFLDADHRGRRFERLVLAAHNVLKVPNGLLCIHDVFFRTDDHGLICNESSWLKFHCPNAIKIGKDITIEGRSFYRGIAIIQAGF